MIVQLSDDTIRKGDQKEFTLEFPFNTVDWDGSHYPVTDARPVKMCLEHNRDNTYRLTANVDCVLHIPCSRCLTDVACPVRFESEDVLDPDRVTDTAEWDEQSYLSGYDLDVNEFIRSELFQNIPVKVLCKPDCKGLCSKCGANLNEGSCGCEDGPLDPRMAAIQDIFRNANQ